MDLSAIQLQKDQHIQNLIVNDINKDDNLDVIITYIDKAGNSYTDIALGYYEKENENGILHFRKITYFKNEGFILGDFDGDRM